MEVCNKNTCREGDFYGNEKLDRNKYIKNDCKLQLNRAEEDTIFISRGTINQGLFNTNLQYFNIENV
jgi:hypothetical protein